jgi:hypothetical protein
MINNRLRVDVRRLKLLNIVGRELGCSCEERLEAFRLSLDERTLHLARSHIKMWRLLGS